MPNIKKEKEATKMDKRKLIYGLLILVIGIGVFASVHLYALSKLWGAPLLVYN